MADGDVTLRLSVAEPSASEANPVRIARPASAPGEAIIRGCEPERFTASAANVLLAWLARFNQEAGHRFEDQAEQRVLWDMEAMLEAKLVEPLRADYPEALAAARARVRDKE